MNKLTENMKYSLLNLFIPTLQFHGADTYLVMTQNITGEFQQITLA